MFGSQQQKGIRVRVRLGERLEVVKWQPWAPRGGREGKIVREQRRLGTARPAPAREPVAKLEN